MEIKIGMKKKRLQCRKENNEAARKAMRNKRGYSLQFRRKSPEIRIAVDVLVALIGVGAAIFLVSFMLFPIILE